MRFRRTAAVLGLILQLLGQRRTGCARAHWAAPLSDWRFSCPFIVLRAFGAGDVKAMATVGIFLGAQLTLLAAAFTLIAGAIIGVIVLLLSSGASSALYRLAGVAAAPIASLRR